MKIQLVLFFIMFISISAIGHAKDISPHNFNEYEIEVKYTENPNTDRLGILEFKIPYLGRLQNITIVYFDNDKEAISNIVYTPVQFLIKGGKIPQHGHSHDAIAVRKEFLSNVRIKIEYEGGVKHTLLEFDKL